MFKYDINPLNLYFYTIKKYRLLRGTTCNGK